jgi:hypothetical protein
MILEISARTGSDIEPRAVHPMHVVQVRPSMGECVTNEGPDLFAIFVLIDGEQIYSITGFRNAVKAWRRALGYWLPPVSGAE